MEAVTDVVFRHVIAAAAPPDVWFSEFTNATGWVHAGERAIGGRLIKTDDEQPIVAQIWGGEPGDMEQLAAHCQTLGYHGIDINMGCPAKSAVKSGGSALIRNPQLAADSIAAAKTAGLPVSVKTRLGYTHVDEWREWLGHLLRQDIVNLTIHLRTKREMSKVPAHHELIREIVALRDEIAPQTLLTINGDIENRAHGLELVRQYPGVDGVMIGRGIFHDPFAFAQNTASQPDTTTEQNSGLKPASTASTPARVTDDGADPKNSVSSTDKFLGADRLAGPEDSDLRENSKGIFDDGSGRDTHSLHRKQALLNLLHLHLDLYDEYHEQTGRPYETLKRFYKIYVRDFDGASDMRARLMETRSIDDARKVMDNV